MAIKSNIEVQKNGVTKFVSTKNDELIVYTGALPLEQHVLVGITLKKMLEYVHVSQAIAALISFGRCSKFPILQVSAMHGLLL